MSTEKTTETQTLRDHMILTVLHLEEAETGEIGKILGAHEIINIHGGDMH